jgi:hypothetical protein
VRAAPGGVLPDEAIAPSAITAVPRRRIPALQFHGRCASGSSRRQSSARRRVLVAAMRVVPRSSTVARAPRPRRTAAPRSCGTAQAAGARRPLTPHSRPCPGPWPWTRSGSWRPARPASRAASGGPRRNRLPGQRRGHGGLLDDVLGSAPRGGTRTASRSTVQNPLRSPVATGSMLGHVRGLKTCPVPAHPHGSTSVGNCPGTGRRLGM